MGYNYSSVARAAELAAPVTGSSTALTVSSVTGFPPPPFTLVLDVAQESEEIVTVTAVAGSVLTVQRGQDGTAAVPHLVGAVCRHAAVARDFRNMSLHMDATAGVHGLGSTASVVGTSTPQALTNKTFDGAQNTVTNLPTTAFANSAVATSKIADAAVTTPKIADASVTTAKVGDAQVTTPKVADLAVTTPKLAAASVTPAKLVGRSVRVVANKAARDALVAAEPPSVEDPLVVWQSDTNQMLVCESASAGFHDVSGKVAGRYTLASASGPLNGTVNLAPQETIPAAPFGASPYQLRVSAAVSVTLPSGLGGRLRVYYDGVLFAQDQQTNAGSTPNTVTLQASNVAYVNNPASDTEHTVRAEISSLAGQISVGFDGWFSIEAQARVQL